MQQIILLITANGAVLRTLAPCSLVEERQTVEEYRKDGWIKVSSEYVPDVKTNVTVLSKKEAE